MSILSVPRLRRAIPWLIGFAITLVALLDAYRPFLELERPILHPEVIVVLGGDSQMRPRMAAVWHRADTNVSVLISGRGDWPRMQLALLSNGIPAERILVETNSASTYENALLTAPILASNGWHRVLLVTSAFHTRRALATFEKVVPGVEFGVVGVSGSWERRQYGTWMALRWSLTEYKKLLWYWLLGRI